MVFYHIQLFQHQMFQCSRLNRTNRFPIAVKIIGNKIFFLLIVKSSYVVVPVFPVQLHGGIVFFMKQIRSLIGNANLKIHSILVAKQLF